MDYITPDSPGASGLARQTLAELEAKLARYRAEHSATRQELQDLEPKLTQQFLQGSTTAREARQKREELRADLEMLEHAIAQLERDIAPARITALYEQAAAERERAQRMEQDAAPIIEEHQRRVAHANEMLHGYHMVNEARRIKDYAAVLDDKAWQAQIQLDDPRDPTVGGRVRR